MRYECEYFDIKELVSQEIYEPVKDSNKWKLWMLFDIRALIVLDALRARYGEACVNTWVAGGDHSYRGYRPDGCAVGSRWSQHRRGAAFDVTFKECTAQEVRDDIGLMSMGTLEIQNLHAITRIEDNVDWLHFDTGNCLNNGITII